MIDYTKAAKALIDHISGARTLTPAERKVLAVVLQADWKNMQAALNSQLPALKAALATRMKSFETETETKALSKRGARNLRTLAL